MIFEQLSGACALLSVWSTKLGELGKRDPDYGYHENPNMTAEKSRRHWRQEAEAMAVLLQQNFLNILIGIEVLSYV